MLKNNLILICLLSFGLIRCGASAGDPVTDGSDGNKIVGVVLNKKFIEEDAGSMDCENGTYLTYENFGKSFLQDHCVSCHSSSLAEESRSGAPIDINLDTYEQILIYRAEIQSQSAKKKKPNKMPPYYKVNSTDIGFWREWLYCGAPEN